MDAHFDRASWQLVKNSDEYNHPDEDVLEGMDFQKFGSVIVGEQGKLFFNRGKNNWVLKPSSVADGFEWPEPSIPRAANQNNYQEWLDAIQKARSPKVNLTSRLAGPMTETILLGVLAQRVPDTRLEWDAEKMEVEGRPELKKYIQRPYRDGWDLKV